MRVLAAALLAMLPTVASAYTDMSFIDSYEKARSYVEKHKSTAMKDGFALQLTFCDTDACALNKAQALVALIGAYKKDYGDQRNLASCLRYGCSNAIVPNEPLACAWRMVILASGSTLLEQSDINYFQKDCSPLNGAQLATAKAQAANLFQMVYRREISRDFQ